jgi:hypothetical protein
MPSKTSTTSTTRRRAVKPKPEAPALDKTDVLEYLKAEASTDDVGTVELPKPYVRPTGGCSFTRGTCSRGPGASTGGRSLSATSRPRFGRSA